MLMPREDAMENNILVSICCTAYNHEAYLRQTLESFVSQQTDFAFEVLVNDDASTDATADIMREFAEKYPDVVRPFYQKENLFSRDIDIYAEVFFPVARGKYTALCEGDDYWNDPTKLQRTVDFLEAHPEYSACVHNTMIHYVRGDQTDRPLLKMSGDRDVRFEDILSGMSHTFHFSAIVGKTDVIADKRDFYYVGLRNGFTDQCEALWLYLHGPIRCLDRIMSVYRVHSGASAWSAETDGQYAKYRRFIAGEVAMLQTFLPYVSGEEADAVRETILEREFELMYFEGRDREQRRPPYDAILRRQSFSYRAKNLVKCLFPALQRRYRARRGFGSR